MEVPSGDLRKFGHQIKRATTKLIQGPIQLSNLAWAGSPKTTPDFFTVSHHLLRKLENTSWGSKKL
jgi:hypothetical protein